MYKTTPFSFTYLPLLVQLKCVEPARLPAYLGSTLHGIVGWALSSQPHAYSYLFENRKFGGAKQDIVNPYMIEPPRYRVMYESGDILSFHIVLLGNAVHYVQDVVTALANAKQFGLGANRKLFVLESILHGERYAPIWQGNEMYLNSASPEKLVESVQYDYSKCSIQLLTPLRIRRGGELVLRPDFITIIRNITNRLDMLVERYGGSIERDSISTVLEQAV